MEKILGLKLKLLSEKNQDLMFDYFQKNKNEEESDEDPKNRSNSRSKSRAKHSIHQRNLLDKKQNDHIQMQNTELTKKLYNEQVQRKKKLRQELIKQKNEED